VAAAAANRDATGRIVASVWFAGVAISLVPMLAALYRLRVLRKTARTSRLDAAYGLERVRVLVHERVTAPLTFGWIRPYVLLPDDAETWPDADLHRALVHELEHIRRADWPVHVLARMVCALYWFHPLVWRAWRQLRLEADRACDDAVADRGLAYEFANQLVMLAGRIGSQRRAPALSMTGGDLVTRVNALLNPNQRRGRAGLSFVAASAAAAMVLGTTLGAVGAVERTTVDRPATQHATEMTLHEPTALRNVAIIQKDDAPTPSRAPSTQLRSMRTQPAEQAPASTSTPTPATDFVIGFGDVLTITVWQQRDLAVDVIVRPDGKITLPLLNDVEANGQTPEQLRDRLTRALDPFIADPIVTVAVKAINSRKVYITGGVQKPGPYDLLSPMTVSQLISAAGGLREFVTGKKILVVRTEDGKQIALPFDFTAVASGQNLEQDILLKQNDRVFVPE
jgi:polysaccharide export outer membrane protein